MAEKFHDDRGLIWPAVIAPAQVHLVNLGKHEEIRRDAEELYATLQQRGVTVLWDERDASAGVKLADADLIGLPYRVVISSRTRKEGKVEVKARTGEAETMSVDALLALLPMR